MNTSDIHDGNSCSVSFRIKQQERIEESSLLSALEMHTLHSMPLSVTDAE